MVPCMFRGFAEPWSESPTQRAISVGDYQTLDVGGHTDVLELFAFAVGSREPTSCAVILSTAGGMRGFSCGMGDNDTVLPGEGNERDTAVLEEITQARK